MPDFFFFFGLRLCTYFNRVLEDKAFQHIFMTLLFAVLVALLRLS